MNHKQLIRSMLLLTLISGAAGCKHHKSEPPTLQAGDGGSPGGVIDPDGNSGKLSVGIAQFSSNTSTTGCFPKSEGWDKYYPVPYFFLGPNTPGCAQCYTNSGNIASVTVKTCDPTNGTTLETGIVIYYEFGTSDRACATNNCMNPPKLTVDQRSMDAGKRYRATVYYKSGTIGTLTNIMVFWSYP